MPLKNNKAKRAYYKQYDATRDTEKRNAKAREKHRERTLTGWRHGKPAATRQIPDICESCGISFEKTPRGPFLDHDHHTNEFRGWLCQHCNTALGMVGDNREGVLRLLQYLDRYELTR